jgi:FlaA1/EpsC-like NDP-sugar epimerase
MKVSCFRLFGLVLPPSTQGRGRGSEKPVAGPDRWRISLNSPGRHRPTANSSIQHLLQAQQLPKENGMSETDTLPPQHQDQQPGQEEQMQPHPEFISGHYRAAEKLAGKVAVITGGDSGIGRAVAVTFARERADVVLLYLDETEDALKTRQIIESLGQQCLEMAGDVAEAGFCGEVARQVQERWGKLDILINNAGEQHPQDCLYDICEEQWERTFRTNISACSS